LGGLKGKKKNSRRNSPKTGNDYDGGPKSLFLGGSLGKCGQQRRGRKAGGSRVFLLKRGKDGKKTSGRD